MATDLGSAAFRAAPLIINQAQAEALAALLWDGVQAGNGDEAKVGPVRAAALMAVTPPEALGMPEIARDRKTGEALPDPEDPDLALMEAPMPASNTLAVIAEDGRIWQLTRAGICWPQPRATIKS